MDAHKAIEMVEERVRSHVWFERDAPIASALELVVAEAKAMQMVRQVAGGELVIEEITDVEPVTRGQIATSDVDDIIPDWREATRTQ